jgi:hypothetical protein
MADTPQDEKKLSPALVEKILKDGLEQFHIADEAEREPRREALEADRFALGQQWDNAITQSRQLQGRPCLTINKTAPAIRQVTNDARQNRPQVKVSPTDDGTEETAEILEGMVRHIQVSSNSDVAIDTAFDQSVRGGWGYYRVLTKYVNDESFLQEIKIDRIKDRFTVYFDPFCMEPDYSDARFAFIVNDIPKSEFERDYPTAKANNDMLGGQDTKQWIGEDTIRVAEYWRIEETDAQLHELEDGTTISSDKYDLAVQHAEQAPHITPPKKIKRSRPIKQRKIMCYKITAFDVLESYEWPGKYIPIIPVLGEDHEIDGKRYLRGMTYSMMDAQRQYNYWTSAATEAIALAPKAPWLVAEGQIEGYEQIWQNSNVGTPAVLTYKPTALNGAPIPGPQRNQAEPPIQAMTLAIRQASDDMKSSSGIFDASLGNRSNETSGKAIMARQREGDTSTFHFIDNLTRSMRFLGLILLDLIPKIYDTHRVIRIVHEDGTHETTEINQHLKPGVAQQAQGAVQKIYDVTTAKYDVVINTGPSYTTKRQEALESMINISQAYPPLWHVAGDLMAKNMDWPGAMDLSERLKKTLPPQLQDQDEQDPQKAIQQNQQLSQMVEQLTQALHAAHDQIDTKAAELASREKIAQMNNETNLSIAEINALVKQMGNQFAVFKEELNHLRGQKQLDQQDQQFAAQHSLAQQQAAQAAAQPGA